MKKLNQKREQRFPFVQRFLTGMIIALSLTLMAFEWTTVRTIDSNIILDSNSALLDDDLILPPITYRPEVAKKPTPTNNTTELKIVKDIFKQVKKVEQTINDNAIIDNYDHLTQFNIEDYREGDEIFDDEDIVHTAVEIFAHFDDCSHLRGKELMECSILGISNRVKEEFVISNQLKDIGGRQAAHMTFVIDKEGNIHSIMAIESSSKAIERDAIKALKKLPKMNPAMQQGRAVSLQLKIPIQVIIRD